MPQCSHKGCPCQYRKDKSDPAGHGWHDWCVEVKGGIPQKLWEDIYEFHNQLDELEDLMKRHGDQTAAIIITPVGHPLAEKVQMPKPGFLEEVRAWLTNTGRFCFEIRAASGTIWEERRKYSGLRPICRSSESHNGYP